MHKLFSLFFSFLFMYAVDPEEAGGEVESLADQAWEAVQSDEKPEAVSEEPATEITEETEQATEEQPKTETTEDASATEAKAPEGLTDDDLKPLEGAKAKTQERFQKVTEGYKAEKERADALQSDIEKYKQSFDSLRQLGFNDEAAASDLVEFSAYRNILVSGDVDQFQQIIANQIKQFEELHGKRVAVSASVIDDYDDIKQKVEGMEIDEGTAIEVARARKLQERATRQAQQSQQHIQTEAQHQQLLQESANQVDQLEKTWRNNDPDYQAVIPHLRENLPDIWKLPPAQWATAVDMQYKAIKKALASAPKPNTPAPLRGNGHMSGQRQHTTLQDAVLAEMGMDAD